MKMKQILTRAALLLLALGLAAGSADAGAVLEPYEAPEWAVSEWINGDPGKLANHKHKVVLIEFFQLWCPGCNSFSIPLFQRWNELWGDRDDVLIVSIHTVFEGHDVQTPAQLKTFIRQKGITHPVGIDAYHERDQEIPRTMKLYDTGGTPHVVIVDKRGEVRFSHFGEFDPAPVEAFVERLLKERVGKIERKPSRR